MITRRQFLVGAASVALATSLAFAKPQPEPVVKKPSANYFIQAAQADSELTPLLENNNEGLRKKIAETMAAIPHLTPPDYRSNHRNITVWEKPTADQLSALSTVQLLKLHFMLKALSDPEFRRKLQSELKKDTEDKSGEHGGFLLLKSGKVVLEMVPNNDTGCDEMTCFHYEPDANYNPKYFRYGSDVLGQFHFHAREIATYHCAFSGDDYFVNANVRGVTIFFGFSRVSPTRFNADMGIVLAKKDGTITKRLDIDLGTYEK